MNNLIDKARYIPSGKPTPTLSINPITLAAPARGRDLEMRPTLVPTLKQSKGCSRSKASRPGLSMFALVELSGVSRTSYLAHFGEGSNVNPELIPPQSILQPSYPGSEPVHGFFSSIR